jgi:hypothetical protein
VPPSFLSLLEAMSLFSLGLFVGISLRAPRAPSAILEFFESDGACAARAPARLEVLLATATLQHIKKTRNLNKKTRNLNIQERMTKVKDEARYERKSQEKIDDHVTISGRAHLESFHLSSRIAVSVIPPLLPC